jgi:hypothetical protein
MRGVYEALVRRLFAGSSIGLIFRFVAGACDITRGRSAGVGGGEEREGC